jgi:hypothetical protein
MGHCTESRKKAIGGAGKLPRQADCFRLALRMQTVDQLFPAELKA